MRKQFKLFFSLTPIILCLTSIAQADGNYSTFVGEVSYMDDKNNIIPDSVQVEITEGSGVKNFYCDYASGSDLNEINDRNFNNGDHFSEKDYGLNVSHQERVQHTGLFYERAKMKRLASILIFFGLKN